MQVFSIAPDHDHDHDHEHDDHIASRLQQPQQWVDVAVSQSHPGLCGTTVGPGKDAHGVGA